jgi:hypothetical protein
MVAAVSIDQALDIAEQLDRDSQLELISILKKRLNESERERIILSVEQAKKDYTAGLCVVLTPEEIIRDALS